jgi:tRNA1(Val) A37 N6-methylase TrmN6
MAGGSRSATGLSALPIAHNDPTAQADIPPERLAFVKNRPDAAPWLFLVEAQKNRKTGLRVEPDVLISAGAALYGR